MLATVGWLVQVGRIILIQFFITFIIIFKFYFISFYLFIQAAGIHLPSPDGLYDVANPIDAFFHVGTSPIAQVIAII